MDLQDDLHPQLKSLNGDLTDMKNYDSWNEIILHQLARRTMETTQRLKIYNRNQVEQKKNSSWSDQ